MAAHDRIKQFILAHVDAHPEDIAKVTAEQFGITRQAVHRHLNALVQQGQLEASGQTRRKQYTLKVTKVETLFSLAENRQEDVVWREFVDPRFADMKENVLRICQYGFTEIFNNAIDHSEGTHASVKIEQTACDVSLTVFDNGIGILRKSNHVSISRITGRLFWSWRRESLPPTQNTIQEKAFSSLLACSMNFLSRPIDTNSCITTVSTVIG